MARRVEALTGDLVDALPDPCRGCLFWELGAPVPSPATPVATTAVAGPDRSAGSLTARVRKQAWVSARVQEGCPPGRVVRVDGEVVAHALFAPADRYVRRPRPVPPPSRDALLLATLWVQPDRRGHDLGRLLLHAAIREAIHRHLQAVEAYGDRRWRDRACLLPATWLLHEGFTVHREHPRTPLFRLDVRRTARWAESLEHAWAEVLGRLPARAPVPAPGGHRHIPSPHGTSGVDAPDDRGPR